MSDRQRDFNTHLQEIGRAGKHGRLEDLAGRVNASLTILDEKISEHDRIGGDLQNQVAQLRHKIHNRDYDGLKAKVDRLFERVVGIQKSLDEAIQSHRNRIRKLEQHGNQADRHISNLQTRIGKVEKRLDVLSDDQADMHRRDEGQADRMDNIQKQINDVEGRVDGRLDLLSEKLSDMRAAQRALVQAVDSMAEEISMGNGDDKSDGVVHSPDEAIEDPGLDVAELDVLIHKALDNSKIEQLESTVNGSVQLKYDGHDYDVLPNLGVIASHPIDETDAHKIANKLWSEFTSDDTAARSEEEHPYDPKQRERREDEWPIRGHFEKTHKRYGVRICADTWEEIGSYDDCTRVADTVYGGPLVEVETKEGVLEVGWGDWIFEDADGDHYPISHEQVQNEYRTVGSPETEEDATDAE